MGLLDDGPCVLDFACPEYHGSGNYLLGTCDDCPALVHLSGILDIPIDVGLLQFPNDSQWNAVSVSGDPCGGSVCIQGTASANSCFYCVDPVEEGSSPIGHITTL